MSLSQDQHRSHSTILHPNHKLIPRHSRIKSSLTATDTTLVSRIRWEARYIRASL